MRFAVHVERRRLRVMPEANRAILVRHTRQRDFLAHEEIARKQTLMAVVPVRAALGLLLHQVFQLRDEPLVSFFIVRRVGEDDVAVAVEGDSCSGQAGLRR